MMLPENSQLVFSKSEIDVALDILADKLNEQLEGEKPLVLTVMQGGLIFAGQLIPRLRCMLEIDYIHATRYNNETLGSELSWKAYPAAPLQGRTVVILDDILDEGKTLEALINYCESQGAKKVISAVLLRKLHDRCIGAECIDNALTDNVALTVEDNYVFGFGMDYNGDYRHLDSIYKIV